MNGQSTRARGGVPSARGLLIWDVATPDGKPVELSRLDGRLVALAALSDGRVVSSDDSGQLQVLDVPRRTKIAQARCSVTAITVVPTSAAGVSLLTALIGMSPLATSCRTVSSVHTIATVT